MFIIKKYFLFLIILVLILSTNSCIFPLKKEKKSNYTLEIVKKLQNGEEYEVKILSRNYFKIADLNAEEKNIFTKFLYSLKEEDFSNSNISSRPNIYRIFIYFKEETYIIDIIDKDTIIVFPYDGIYKEDIISMKNTYKNYNIYYLCNNIFN